MLKYCDYILTLLITLGCSCSTKDNILDNTDLLFTNSIRLKVPSYSFADSTNHIFNVRGDTNYYTGNSDTMNSSPLFRWDSMGIKIITMAIFNSKPEVINEKINNVKNIIWQWHSGMEFGYEGRVQYFEGRNVYNDTIDYNQIPKPLVKGNYYWAVWGWTGDGTEILCSTRIMSFIVL